VRGYQEGRFSFNVKGGRCEACTGDGTIKIEMNFLPDVYVPCEVCKGARYNRETLDVHYKGKTVADVLDMPIEEAAEFFAPITSIARYLRTLVDVGLGYVRLGQPAPPCPAVRPSGSSWRASCRSAPTAAPSTSSTSPRRAALRGHPQAAAGDQRLVDKGNSVIVIEHNLDVIKTSDWVIDMGPRAARAAARSSRPGHPEQVAAHPSSYTGQFLRGLVTPHEAPARRAPARRKKAAAAS
jgi:excinuclease ABC subunit A